MEFVGLLTDVPRRDNVVKALGKVIGCPTKKAWDGVTSPIIVGNNFGMDDIQMECRDKGLPYLYIDHAYFDRRPQMERFRLCVSATHCNDWRDSDRSPTVKVRDWKQPGQKIIVLAPSEKSAKVNRLESWAEETVEILKKHTDRDILVKTKDGRALNDVLTKAFVVVGCCSVADVDSILLGVPCFSGPYSPAYQVAEHDLSKIETPSFPDRGQWLRSLAASEWSLDEVELAWERVKCLLLPTQNSRQPLQVGVGPEAPVPPSTQ